MEWYQEIATEDMEKSETWHYKRDYDFEYIYTLYDDDNNVIYIGQSKFPAKRIKYHDEENVKDFFTFKIDVIPHRIINDIEADLIVIYNPKHNHCLPNNYVFKTIFELKQEAKEMGINFDINEKIEKTRSFIIGSYRYWCVYDIFDYRHQKLTEEGYEYECK